MAALEFGIIDTGELGLPFDQLLTVLERVIFTYSYDFEHPPDFRGLFIFIATNFGECDDLDFLERANNLLSHIAGYKLGVFVADIFARANNVVAALLQSRGVAHQKSAIDFIRKVSRAIGPRVVFQRFIAPNAGVTALQRGLIIAAHQLLVDNPTFPFAESDFGQWATELSSVPGIGGRLETALKARVSGYSNMRPPTVPPLRNLEEDVPRPRHQGRRPPPHSAKPEAPHRQLTHALTNRQQQVREFVDEPFEKSESVAEFATRARTELKNSDWEERCPAYNVLRRLIRYAPASVTDDDIHNLVTAALDDVSSPRAALALASVAAVQEAFAKRSDVMEFELARIMPVVCRLHQKTAQFFEAALAQCCEEIVRSMPAKRLMSVLNSNFEPKGARLQTAIARFFGQALAKCVTAGERPFSKNSNDIVDVVKNINKLLGGSATDTRDAAREAARAASQIYGADFPAIVSRALDQRDVGGFLRVL